MFKHLSKRLVELAQDFYLVKGPDNARFPYCNAFLLTGRQTVLVDAGLDIEIIEAIDQVKKIDTLVISHPHPDHILNWAYLADRRLLLPSQTTGEAHELVTLGTRFMGSESRGRVWADIFGNHYGMKALKEPDARFDDKDVLDFEPFKLKAIHSPGHVKDHYCFFEQKTGILLTSDVDFSNFGPFYGHPECEIDQFKTTIETLKDIPYSMVCSSHKRPIKGSADTAFDYFLNGFDRHEELVRKLCQNKPCTIEEMVRISPFYHNKMAVPLFQKTFEFQMISKCIDNMIKNGRMILTLEGYRAE